MSKKLIYKDNSIIEASYKLSLIEQRLVLIAISKINSAKALKNNEVIKVTASEYSSLFGITEEAAFREMRKAVNDLYRASIKVIVEPGRFDEFRWISRKSGVDRKSVV